MFSDREEEAEGEEAEGEGAEEEVVVGLEEGLEEVASGLKLKSFW